LAIVCGRHREVLAVRARWLDVPALAVVATLGLSVGAASAAKTPLPTTGPGLQPIGCVKDPVSSANCAQSAGGLQDVEGIAVSPGGETLYAAGFSSNAVAWLNRSGDGSLSPGSCVDAGTTGACPASFGPIGGPADVEAAGDSAYSAGFTQGALVQYARGGDGSLTPAACFASLDFGGLCTDNPAPRESDDLAITPDGASVYEAGGEVVQYARAPGGSLTYVSCAGNGNPACPVQGAGLEGAFAIDVSPDGQSVYVVVSRGLVHLSRAPDGSLSYVGSQSGNGMGTPFDVAVSPDGTSVYVVSFSSEAVSHFTRAPDGSLTPAGCYAGPKGDQSCTPIPFSTKGGWAVAVSADGSSVYTTGQTADSVVSFARAGDGSLTPLGCVLATDADKGFRRSASASARGREGECTIQAEGMEDPRGVYASRDGANLYVGSDQGAVVPFRIDREPPTTKVKGPKRTSSHRPKLKLKSSEPGSTFLCQVNNGGAKPCNAKFKPKLGGGKNKIQVVAVDPAGNPDPTPAKKKVTVTE
jgi:DNA-binding beta-propeller fold protein YncE